VPPDGDHRVTHGRIAPEAEAAAARPANQIAAPQIESGATPL